MTTLTTATTAVGVGLRRVGATGGSDLGQRLVDELVGPLPFVLEYTRVDPQGDVDGVTGRCLIPLVSATVPSAV